MLNFELLENDHFSELGRHNHHAVARRGHSSMHIEHNDICSDRASASSYLANRKLSCFKCSSVWTRPHYFLRTLRFRSLLSFFMHLFMCRICLYTLNFVLFSKKICLSIHFPSFSFSLHKYCVYQPRMNFIGHRCSLKYMGKQTSDQSKSYWAFEERDRGRSVEGTNKRLSIKHYIQQAHRWRTTLTIRSQLKFQLCVVGVHHISQMHGQNQVKTHGMRMNNVHAWVCIKIHFAMFMKTQNSCMKGWFSTSTHTHTHITDVSENIFGNSLDESKMFSMPKSWPHSAIIHCCAILTWSRFGTEPIP